VASCPACGKELPGEFPFCPFCGVPLAETAPTPALEERKVVSVLFCDLVGFTAASEGVDPEDVRARIRPYHERVSEEIEAHGGTVEKFVGDAVMAVFGAPVAHEDDAERAVRAGLRILEAIEELNGADPGLALQVRIGVNTGEAVVALDAHPAQGEGFVTGDVVNTASRLQGAAPVNGVAVSEQTYRQTERVFDYERLEPVVVKGKAAPVSIWRPLRAQARLGTDVTRSHATPLVGRELEKALLIGTFERSAQQRSCQLVSIVGEPGVGKSRLCAELLTYLEKRPGLVRWRQGRCLPYGEWIAFWALGEIVKAECGILESDSPAEVSAKLDRAVPPSVEERSWLLARLRPLIGFVGEPVAQEESFAAWRAFVELLAADNPCVLVVEDLHWADSVLLAFLEHLADWAQDVPLLVLCTTRPELYERYPHFGTDARNSQRINLAPLSDDETVSLLAALLERSVLPAGLERSLLERAGGNPLYAEEFVRLLVDRDLLAAPEELLLPDSLQALIAARLDTLTTDRKALLQDAAVVGKVFWVEALSWMGGRDTAEVEQALHELARKELVKSVRSSSMQGRREYSFWHALVRDVCYQQIPRSGRAGKHEAAAEWIEQEAGERTDDLADVLAHHYRSALELHRAAGRRPDDLVELRDKAIHALILAGERALPLDVASAETSFAAALELAGPEHPALAQLLESRANIALQRGLLRDAEAALDEALSFYLAAGDTFAAARTLSQSSIVAQRRGETDLAESTASQALELVQALPPGPELVAAQTNLAGFYSVAGRFALAVDAAEKAIALAHELGFDPPARALGYRGKSRAVLGDRGGLTDMREALDLALDRGESREAAVLYNNLALELWPWEGPAASLTASEEGIEFCHRRGITSMGLAIAVQNLTFLADRGRTGEVLDRAELLAEQGETLGDLAIATEARIASLRATTRSGSKNEQLLKWAHDLCERVRPTREPQSIAPAYAAAAEVFLLHGRITEARALLEELIQLVGVPVDPYHVANLPALVRSARQLPEIELGDALITGAEALSPQAGYVLTSCKAELLEGRDDHERAAEAYLEAESGWEHHGNVPERAYALLGQGRCLVALEDPAAEEPLRQAAEMFSSMGSRPALAETEALIAQTTALAS